MATLFFSYSHRDETLRDELEIHLTMLKRQGVITTWHDRRIGAGKEFGKEISHYLEEAEIILLLVSPDFLASDYCYDVEMARALERHKGGEARVIPVILRPCDWHSAPFRQIAGSPKGRQARDEIRQPGRRFSGGRWSDQELLRMNCGLLDLPRHKPPCRKPPPPEPLQMFDPATCACAGRLPTRTRMTFLEQAFEFIANFFEGSLTELEKRTQGISTKFRRIDTNHFTAAIYHNGAAKSQCKIWLAARDRFTGNIHYSSDPSTRDNSLQ